MAGISFAGAATATWPRTNRASLAPALTTCSGGRPAAGSDEPRRGLAVDGPDLARHGRPESGRPLPEAGEQGGGIEAGGGAAEGIVGRDAAGQVEEATEDVELAVAEALEVSPAASAARGADRQEEDVAQGVTPGTVPARVGQSCKGG